MGRRRVNIGRTVRGALTAVSWTPPPHERDVYLARKRSEEPGARIET